MNKPRFLEDRQRIQQLGGKDFDELSAQPTERVLLDELVEIGREEFKDKAQMAFVNKRIAEAKNVVLVVGIVILVEHFQYCDLHHTLVEISRLIFDHLDGNNLIRPDILAFYDLAKGALAKNIENEISDTNTG